MSVLIIDCGSYSVKFLRGNFHRKHFKVSDFQEFLLNDIIDKSDIDSSIQLYQHEIISRYLNDSNFTGRIISQIPNNFLTSRYLELPVNNIKKAELMIPFQLDENLPFPINESHYISSLYKNSKGQMSAIVQIAEDSTFSKFHNFLHESNTMPSSLVSELGTMQSFVEDRKFSGHVCIIDIGHSSTKSYFICNDKILSNHAYSIAGKTLNEVISKTYNISEEEARVYKHENSYFLTEDQINDVNQRQRDFAIIMKQTFIPLVQQIERWILGYRIKTGFNIENIYLTGGTSSIKNIESFLTEQTGINVQQLNIVSLDSQLKGDEKSNSMLIPFIMGQSQKFKSPPHSFLTKNYASGLSNGIKLEDTSFSLYRLLILTMIIATSILIENTMVINKRITGLDRSIKKKLKAPDLNLSKKKQRKYKRQPKKIQYLLSKKEKIVKSDLQLIKHRQKFNALTSLSLLSNKIGQNESVSLVQITSNKSKTTAKFKATTKRDLLQLKKLLQSLNLNGLKIREKDRELHITFSRI